MAKFRVDVWSDIACPWCYVGKRRLEAALGRFSGREETEVVWRAFELDPSAPRERDPSVSHSERIAKKYGRSVSQAKAMTERMTEVARADGIEFDFEHIRSGNTFDAHRVVHFALERDVQDAVKERFLRGYLSEGEAIGDPEVLIRLAAEAGLDPLEVRNLLASDAHTDAVRADEEEAQALGIHGVPFFVINGKYAVSGAQPAELLLQALNQAWSEHAAAEPAAFAEGAACGPDGC